MCDLTSMGGAVSIVMLNGFLTYLNQSLPRQDLLAFVAIVPLESLWLLILVVLMWRQSRKVPMPRRECSSNHL